MLLRLGRGVRLKGHRVLCLNDRGHRIQACGGGDDDGGSDQQDIAHGPPPCLSPSQDLLRGSLHGFAPRKAVGALGRQRSLLGIPPARSRLK